MILEIPAVYTDKLGTINTLLTNDFDELSINLDGVVFTSGCLHDFNPVDPDNIPARLMLDEYGCLTGCKLFFKLPIAAWKNGHPIEGLLATEINLLSESVPSHFHFSFEIDGETIEIGQLNCFDGMFSVLISKLPDSIMLRSCYTCQFADYNVAGSSEFGSMLCFKNIRSAYLQVKNKSEYMDIMDQFDRRVQETYYCEDFEIRGQDIGYRG